MPQRDLALPAEPAASVRPATYRDILMATARKHGVPPELALEVARQKSNFDPMAISPKGARGMMQLLPSTAQTLR